MTDSPPVAPPLLCVMGPTAAGKTDLAIELAEALDGELISVDSALVYRGLDIGAAKPSYPHHLIDIRDPTEPYSAAEFASDAREAIAAIRGRNRLPILVGGTMLYFRSLLMGLDDMPDSSPEVRATIEREARAKGWPAMHAELAEVDPEAAARIHPNHSQRIGRALEVWRQSGVPISTWQRGESGAVCEPHLALVVNPVERRWLHERIAKRMDTMISRGFLHEVQGLYAREDLQNNLPAIRAVGYRQLWGHLAGEYDLDEAVTRACAATRQLAKRQLTWLRSWPDAVWLETDAQGAFHSLRHTLGESQRGADGLYGAEGPLFDVAIHVWRNYLRTPKV